jgi:hypothetical protein
LIVGVVGLALSVFWMAVWADRRRGVAATDGAVVRERDVVERRDVI